MPPTPWVVGTASGGQPPEIRCYLPALGPPPPQPRQQDLEQWPDALGYQKHDNEQEQAVEEVAELRERGGHFRQGCQHHRAQERPQDSPAPTDDDAYEEEEAQVDDEGVRSDVALKRREEPSRHPGRDTAEYETRQLRPDNGNP